MLLQKPWKKGIPTVLASHKDIPGTNPETKLGAVQINIVDYKFGLGVPPEDLRETKAAVRRLLDSLREHTTFIPKGKDKTVAGIELQSHQIGAQLELLLRFGKPDDPYFKPFQLPLPPQYRGNTAEDLHRALSAMCTIEPGGNVPNMVRNFAHLMRSTLLQNTQFVLHTTKEPTFEAWFGDLPPDVRDRFTKHTLTIQHRTGLHLQYDKDNGDLGTLGIGTPTHSTIPHMKAHIGILSDCDHTLVSESLFTLAETPECLRAMHEFQNPSTAFREQCALESYNHMLKNGAHIPIVSMNDEEMPDYIKSLEHRRNAPKEEKDSPLSFAGPFDANRTLNEATVRDVTNSFARYFACLTPRPQSRLYFPLSVSCGGTGGYHIVCPTDDREKYVVFSSAPRSRNGTDAMLKLTSGAHDIDINTQLVMGAGDAVATVLSLANQWDIEAIVRSRAKESHPLDEAFIRTAAMLFVSLLSRVAGEILYHSTRCDWSVVPPDAFPDIIRKTAHKSLEAALSLWGRGPKAVSARVPEWDIDVALWEV